MEENENESQPKDEWVSVSEAADRLGCDKETVRRYLRSGQLQGKKNIITGIWKISKSSLEEIARG